MTDSVDPRRPGGMCVRGRERLAFVFEQHRQSSKWMRSSICTVVRTEAQWSEGNVRPGGHGETPDEPLIISY